MEEVNSLIYNEDSESKVFISNDFNFILDKETKSSFSWGKTKDETPLFNPISPEEVNLILNDDFIFDKNMIDKFLNLNVEKKQEFNTSISCINSIDVFVNKIQNEDEIKKLFNYFESLNIVAFLNINYNNDFSLKNIFKIKVINVNNVLLSFSDHLDNVIGSIKLLIENNIFVKCKFYLTNENFENVYKILSNDEYPQSLMTFINFNKTFKKQNLSKLTEYLKSKTYSKLVSLYKPKVSSALNKPLVLNVSANKAWTNLTTSYNTVGAVPNKAAKLIGQKEPFPEVEVDLATYATEKALDGLFIKIAEEEKNIRANPLDYASSMIKKVFGAVKSGNY
jgi:hypothetical protein